MLEDIGWSAGRATQIDCSEDRLLQAHLACHAAFVLIQKKQSLRQLKGNTLDQLHGKKYHACTVFLIYV